MLAGFKYVEIAKVILSFGCFKCRNCEFSLPLIIFIELLDMGPLIC